MARTSLPVIVCAMFAESYRLSRDGKQVTLIRAHEPQAFYDEKTGKARLRGVLLVIVRLIGHKRAHYATVRLTNSRNDEEQSVALEPRELPEDNALRTLAALDFRFDAPGSHVLSVHIDGSNEWMFPVRMVPKPASKR